MAKAKRTKEMVEKTTFTIIEINKEDDTFKYINENGDEQHGDINNIFINISTPFDITLKASDKEELDINFNKEDSD